MRLAGRLVRDGRIAPGWVQVEGDRITAVGDGGRGGPLVAPGLVDLQVNGAAGVDVTGGRDALDRIGALLLDHGVTSFLPTVISTSDEVALAAAREVEARVGDPVSPVEGLHLEGPYLALPGAHPPAALRARFDGEPAMAYASPALRLVTLAPELPGALDLLAWLRGRGVTVSLGHSAADAETAARAVDAGARMATHVFNAMGPLAHRAPGLAGVALDDARVRCGVIADGLHVDPLVLRLIRRAAGGRVVLVSDSAAAAGTPAAPRVARTPGGVLAGSALTLDEGVRRWSLLTGASLAEAWAAASERPARAVGLPAGLRPGAPADLVVLDDDARVQRVMRRGAWVRS